MSVISKKLAQRIGTRTIKQRVELHVAANVWGETMAVLLA